VHPTTGGHFQLAANAFSVLTATAQTIACGGSSNDTSNEIPAGSYAVGVTVTGAAASGLTIPVLVQ
jgi:hypothetical protein